MAFDPVTAIMNVVEKGIDHFFPPSMSEKDKEALKQNMTMFVAKESRAESSEFRNFILAYEGSAADYKTIPFIGPLMMLIRGLVRPICTYGTFYFDFLYFTSTTRIWTIEQSKLLAIMNIIVLVFWFGEKILVNTGLSEVIMNVFVSKKV